MTAIHFKDKTTIVTGAATGLGLAFATALAEHGAHVVLADIALDRAQAAAASLQTRFPAQRITAHHVDVSDENSTLALAHAAAQATGRIDVLVNNAAIYATLKRQPFHQIDVQEWDKVMAVDLKGPFLMARAVFAWMRNDPESSTGAQGTGGVNRLVLIYPYLC